MARRRTVARRGAHWRRRRLRMSTVRQRILILVAAAMAVGIALGVWLPTVNPTVGEITGEYEATGAVSEALDRLVVDDVPGGAGYRRDGFGYRSTDVDGNGCDVRDDVLARDLEQVRFSPVGGCRVASGVLHDPYTGATIDFVRGPQTSAAVQIDHVVALENAWQSGAKSWSKAQRYRFGNDMDNLLAVDGKANQEKGSASAAYWLPTNGAYQCSYVARQVGIKTAYGLTVTTQERRAMKAVLRSCPTQRLP